MLKIVYRICCGMNVHKSFVLVWELKFVLYIRV